MMPPSSHIAEPLDVLRQYWGYSSFRPLQEDIVQSVLAGQDTLALLPTGGGKSICFQVPALAREGLCIVVSPLIALMKDQVYNLVRRGIPSRAVFSGMSAREIDIALDNCVYGSIKFLYVSPERIQTDIFRERVKRMNVNLLAVDEAHCISQWGYDFRPPYLQIAELRDLLPPQVPVLALTASATPAVQEDICRKLSFRRGYQSFKKSFSRTNLHYLAYREENKSAKLLDICNKVGGTGIVYVRNRRRTQQVAEWLHKSGVSANFYHAGLSNDDRSNRQDAWIQGAIRVMVCTNAFGMGIDKPDVRFVVHLDLPDSLEAYYQEAGRAGRDEQRSYVTMLYDDSNLEELEESLDQRYPPLPLIKQVYTALGNYYQLAVGSGQWQSMDFEIGKFCHTYQLSPFDTLSALKVLESEGLIMATDAVYLSPRVKVTATRQALYELEVKNQRLEPLIKLILRSYEGAFDHFVKIKEDFLAKKMEVDTKELRKMLRELQKLGMLFYEPHKEKPQIVFLQPRLDDRFELGMDTNRLRERKEAYRKQIDAMLLYVKQRHRCREQVILHYFGEKLPAPCGRCDICKGRHQTGIPLQRFDDITEAIAAALAHQPADIKDLSASLSTWEGNEVAVVARWLTDHGAVYLDETGLLTWQGA